MSGYRELSRIKERERLEFVRTMLREVREMAEGDSNAFLAYLVEMAYVEACDKLRAMEFERPQRRPAIAA